MKIGRFAVALSCLVLLGSRANAAKYNIRWVLAHDPSVAAEQSARNFAARIEKETGGDIHVQILKSAEYNELVARRMTRDNLLADVAAGKVEMTQMYTAALSRYNPKLLTLGNPYLFRDYDHAESVFEGPLGPELLALVPASSGLRALGTTYSGGFGVFATKERIVRRPADMKDLRLQMGRFPWLPSFVTLLGVEPISAPPEAFVGLAQNDFADALETTVARFDEYGDDRGAKIVNLTNHFLLTTMIVVNEKFYQGLPAKHQRTLTRLAQTSAREERALSIKANQDGRGNLERRGVKFIDLTDKERQAFAEALKPIYSLPFSVLGADLAEAIRGTRTARTASR
jgi:TRAP-type C4-dicarboxylate transport system substrate-binding protein